MTRLHLIDAVRLDQAVSLGDVGQLIGGDGPIEPLSDVARSFGGDVLKHNPPVRLVDIRKHAPKAHEAFGEAAEIVGRSGDHGSPSLCSSPSRQAL